MHVRRALALALTVPLLLAGCSDDPEPTPKMPDPTSSSPSPTESETPEAESAEDFIRRWADENRRMFVTGDTAAFLALGPKCDDCRAIADSVKRIYGAGGRVFWDGWKIRDITRRGDPSSNAFRFVVDSSPTRYREASTGPWKTLNGGRGVQLIVLEESDDGWRVTESKELPE